MKKTALLVISALLFGCTNAVYTSLKDPGYAWVQFENVLVYANGMDLNARQRTETQMQKRFAAYGVTAFRGVDILPPTNTYTIDEGKRILEERGIVSVLILTLSGSGTSTSYVPQTGTTRTTGTVTMIGNTAYFNANTNNSTFGGFYVSKPSASYEGAVYEVATLKKAWISSGTVSGNAFSDFIKLSVSAGDVTVKKIMKDGLYKRDVR